jgi:hypothetical protein
VATDKMFTGQQREGFSRIGGLAKFWAAGLVTYAGIQSGLGEAALAAGVTGDAVVTASAFGIAFRGPTG